MILKLKFKKKTKNIWYCPINKLRHPMYNISFFSSKVFQVQNDYLGLRLTINQSIFLKFYLTREKKCLIQKLLFTVQRGLYFSWRMSWVWGLRLFFYGQTRHFSTSNYRWGYFNYVKKCHFSVLIRTERALISIFDF